jgi:hypothetical protein
MDIGPTCGGSLPVGGIDGRGALSEGVATELTGAGLTERGNDPVEIPVVPLCKSSCRLKRRISSSYLSNIRNFSCSRMTTLTVA